MKAFDTKQSLNFQDIAKQIISIICSAINPLSFKNIHTHAVYFWLCGIKEEKGRVIASTLKSLPFARKMQCGVTTLATLQAALIDLLSGNVANNLAFLSPSL